MLINTAIFPVAGLGTRTLPASKVTAKEMLNVVDKPIIQYAVEEALAAGITEIIFVTAANKQSIEQHFAAAPELEARLLAKGQQNLYELVHEIVPRHVSIKAVIQEQPSGLGHAVLCAHELTGDKPVAVMLADDLIYHEGDNCLQQMLQQYAQVPASTIAIEEVPQADTSKYGIVDMQDDETGLQKMLSIVEKPTPELAPSRFAVVGRYLLSAKIWTHLQNTQAGSGNEIQLTDAIATLAEQENIYLCEFAGTRYDCGSTLGLLKANVELGLKHPQMAAEFSQYLATLAKLR